MTDQSIAPSGLIWASPALAVQAIRRAIASNDHREALALGKGALAQFGGAEIQSFVGYCAQQLGAHREALAACDAALSEDETIWLAHTVRGHSLQALERFEEAREAYEAAAKIDPDDISVLEQRIALTVRLDGAGAARALLATEGDTLSAEAAAAIVSRASDAAAASSLSSAMDLLTGHQLNGSIAALRAITNEFPDSSDAWAKLAYALQQAGRCAEALDVAATALDLAPPTWLGALTRGHALRTLDRAQEARIAYGKAVALAPEYVSSQILWLQASYKADGLEAARFVRARASSAVCESPDFAKAWRSILLHSGAFDEISVQSHDGRERLVVERQIEPAFVWAQRRGMDLLEPETIESIRCLDPAPFGVDAPSVENVVQGLRPYVVSIPNATIASKSSLVLTEDGRVLNDVSGHAEYGDRVSLAYDKTVVAQAGRAVLLDHSRYDLQEIEGGVFLSGLASDAFGHWVPEFLPKLRLLEQHPAFATLPIIVDAEMPASHFDYLSRLTQRPLLQLPPDTAFRCRHLLYAPPPTFYPVETIADHNVPQHELNVLSPRALAFLRDRGPRPDVGVGPRRLLLARKKTGWRRLSNEIDLEASLVPLGFQAIYLEDLSLDEQFSLFAGAEAIVAPNGSSMLNLIHASKQVVLVSLWPNRAFNWSVYVGPMAELGYRTITICGTGNTSDQKHDDYAIEISDVLNALAQAGIS